MGGGGGDGSDGGGGGGDGGSDGGSGSPADRETYTVQRGETLTDIAEKHGVPVSALKQANREKLHTWNGVQGFMAGATIVIPAGSEGGRTASGGDQPSWEEIRQAWVEAGESMASGGAWLLDHLPGGEGKGKGGKSGGGNEETKTPKWIRIAEGEKGTKEFGEYDIADDEWTWSKEQIQRSNPEIKKYFDAMGYLKEGLAARGDHIPWCGAFVYYCIDKAGHSGARLGGKASNWEGWGKKLKKPVYGAVAVVKGGGHVGFVVGKSGGNIQLLGGNQGDAVNVSTYSVGGVTYYGVPGGYDTSSLPKLGDVGAKEGGDTR